MLFAHGYVRGYEWAGSHRLSLRQQIFKMHVRHLHTIVQGHIGHAACTTHARRTRQRHMHFLPVLLYVHTTQAGALEAHNSSVSRRPVSASNGVLMHCASRGPGFASLLVNRNLSAQAFCTSASGSQFWPAAGLVRVPGQQKATTTQHRETNIQGTHNAPMISASHLPLGNQDSDHL
jgi:hypothetical protein